MKPEPDGPTGAELYKLITETDPFEQWGQFPQAHGTFASSPPHGPLANVFINDKVEATLANSMDALPDGSIIVKESFDENMMEAGDSLTVMWKVKDFNPDNNDWFWAMFAFDGEVLAEGNIGGCIACHGIARDNDFVFLQSLGPEETAGEKLFELISQTDPYDQWGQFPEAPGIIESAPPHGPLARVFVNAEAESAVAAGATSLPSGSIIVKESFDENMTEAGDSLTVMWKVKNFNPDNNDWFWANFAFDGQVLAEGNIAGCIACHGIARDNDFVFLQPLGPE